MLSKFLRISIIFSCFFHVGVAQNAIRNQFENAKIKYAEKIYIHTNKPQYFSGEVIWFKLYNLNRIDSGLSKLSTVAYLELIKEDLGVIYQQKISLAGGMGNGYISLGKNLKSGQYKLRAYTNLMKNGGADTFFEKALNIINTFNLDTINRSALAIDVQFFPEGGDLIQGVRSNVGFKVTASNGKGQNCSGVIVDDKRDTVAKIETFKFGIGRFSFLPKNGKTYTAILTVNGAKINKELPKARQTGYAVTLNDLGSFWECQIQTNTGNRGLTAVVHNGKKILYTNSIQLTNGTSTINIDKAALTEGLHHITFFNSENKPVAERIFFKPITKNSTLKLGLQSQMLESRSQVNLSITANVNNPIPQNVYASATVYKIDTLQSEDPTDIESYINLSSELKGDIENPNYYFSSSSNASDVKLALDNLLLTQGWRRFKWDDQASVDAALTYLPEYEGQWISGRLTNQYNNPSKGISMYLSGPRQKGMFYHTVTDSLGRFSFNTKPISGINEIIIQSKPSQDSVSKISLTDQFYGYKLQSGHRGAASLVQNRNLLSNYHFALQVDEIFGDSLMTRKVPSQPEKYNFYGKPSMSYLFSDYTSFDRVEDILREYVSEVYVSRRQNEFELRTVSQNGPLRQNPLILLDGVPYFDVNKIMQIPSKELERLDVVKELYYYGGETYHGILQFYSKAKLLRDYALNSNALIMDYEGLQEKREFYMPKYDTPAQKSSSIPDFRNAIYWEPNLSLQNGIDYSLGFTTSDLSGNYVVVIEGVSQKGEPVQSKIRFEVRNKQGNL